ncbi:MAG: PP-loop domain protein [Candidatus Aminicenantes bacterium]|jgi:uncharacterized protein|nr:PP-loop domain protein [Candidatus Aminicenantes bacterium]
MRTSPSAAARLEAVIRSRPRAVVAFSGGVDSTLLLRVCRDVLGRQNIVAVTGVSPTYTAEELRTARRVARGLGVEHVLIETDELACKAFAANPADRCYHCKGELFDRILALAAARGIETVYDATNTDDLSDYRPGRRATEERGVTSPLLLAGLAKKDVRRLSKKLGLSSWDKPANPCLASRVPYGTPITLETLDRIRAGEKFIRGLGFAVVRLRHHDRLARIEVPAADFARLMKPATARRITAKLRSLGYLWIALDIEGFRTGSLNRAVAESPAKKPK